MLFVRCEIQQYKPAPYQNVLNPKLDCFNNGSNHLPKVKQKHFRIDFFMFTVGFHLILLVPLMA